MVLTQVLSTFNIVLAHPILTSAYLHFTPESHTIKWFTKSMSIQYTTKLAKLSNTYVCFSDIFHATYIIISPHICTHPGRYPAARTLHNPKRA
jgi:hypothetical protein